MTFADDLADWTDWDCAGYAVGVTLGIFTGDEERQSVKWIFWSANPLGEELANVLDALVRAGILEHRDEPEQQYRWACTQPPCF
jgi:hypothetical protein